MCLLEQNWLWQSIYDCGFTNLISLHPKVRDPMEGQPLAATVSVLKDELHYSPTMAVQSLARLLVIGRALGPERTRSELLPYLTSEIQQGNLNDEVHLAISGGLPQLVEFVGSAEEARGLLAPLRELGLGHGVDTRGGRSYRQVVIDSLVDVSRQLDELAA